MHAVGRVPLQGDDVALPEFMTGAVLRKLRRIVGIAERLGKPFAQAAPVGISPRMGGNDRLLASLQGVIEIVGQDDAVGDKGAEGAAELRRQVTNTRRAPTSSAACLIWVKLCMAEESMPVTRRKSNSRKRQLGQRANSALTC